MQQKNEDGLVIGEPVDFATIQRVEALQRLRAQEEKPAEEPKRGRPAKAADADKV